MTSGWRRLPYFSIALISGAALGYQILLLRVFSIIQWHHLAYMIIGLALLGYGASGTALALAGQRVRGWAGWLYPASLLGFALSCIPAFLGAQALAFSPEELLWEPLLGLRLALIYLILAVPFFLAATAVGTALMCRPRHAARLYAADLAGAGLGGLVAFGTLYVPDPVLGLLLMAALGLLAALVAAVELRRTRVGILIVSGMAVLAALLAPPGTLSLQPSPYKDLEEALRVAGARIEAQRTGPHGQVTVVGSPLVPLREAPGMSLIAGVEPADQRALFVDGNGVPGITRDDANAEGLTFLDRLPTAVPYHMQRPDRVLVTRAGGGLLALQARNAGATRVVALESDPSIHALLTGPYADFSGALFTSPPVHPVVAESRAWLERSSDTFDLIQIAAPGGLTGAGAGLQAMHEDFLFTTQGMDAAFERLTPKGMLAVSSWIRLPPRDSLKLAATLVAMLARQGIADPGAHLAVIRSWQMATFVVGRSPLTAEALSGMTRFATDRGFDIAWFPGMSRSDANYYNQMPTPYLFDGIEQFLSETHDDLIESYKFDIQPATDDRPFFHNFMRWSTLREVAGLLGSGGMPLLEAGFVLLLATLIQALVLAALLILLPLALAGRRLGHSRNDPVRGRTLLYFAGIGLGFMIIELVALHRLVLIVGNPVLTSAIVLPVFLFAAGLGSLFASRQGAALRAARIAGAGTIAATVLWHLMLGPGAPAIATLPGPFAALAAGLSLAPMAFFMGQLFPLGLTAVGERGPGLVAWAWGINGCASVVGAMAGTALAVSFGFTSSLTVALALYGLATLSFPRGPVSSDPA